MWYVYIIDKNGILYTGMTEDIVKRIHEHVGESVMVKLLYKEELPDKFQAARRERQIKGWTRRKKLALIEGNLDLLKRL